VSVSGRLSPLIENAAPLKFACESVTVDPPVLVKVSERFLLLPTCTLPNDRLVGFAVSEPDVTPAPESGMLSGELDAFEVMLSDPVAAPALAGVKITLNETV
jgi:hypothetical protein